MSSGDFRSGSVIAYPYLWRWQSERGETAGRKDRPVCVVLAVRGNDAHTHLVLLAISSKPPGADQVAIEIPEVERKRAGLGEDHRAWVTISEYNYDVAEQSYFIAPGDRALGRLGRAFMRKITVATAELMREGQGRVDRTR